MPKASKAKRPLYVAPERHKWITYVEEGQEDDPIQVEVKVRKNLTNDELETLPLSRSQKAWRAPSSKTRLPPAKPKCWRRWTRS